jgi:hypothetical protein
MAILAVLVFVMTRPGPVIELIVASPATSGGQLYFDSGVGFNDDESSSGSIIPLPQGGHLLRFSAPRTKIKVFRLEPFMDEGTLLISDMQLQRGNGQREQLSGISIIPGREIERFEYTPAGAALTIARGAKAPFLTLVLMAPIDLSPTFATTYLPAAAVLLLAFAGSFLLIWGGTLLHDRLLLFPPYRQLAVLGSGLVAVIYGVTRLCSSMAGQLAGSSLYRWFAARDSRQVLFLSGSLMMTIAGGRLLVLQRYGTDLPWYDQWGVEGVALYKPYFQGTLTWANFFEPCNEHRIVLTRLLALTELMINGLWDNLLQTVINALIYTATAVGLFWLVARNLGGLARICWWLAVAITFTLPFGWENALWGFQSQFYLLVAISGMGLYVASLEGAFTGRRLALLLVLQILALFTMSSGVLATAAALGMYVLLFARNRSDRSECHQLLLKTAVAIGVAILGYQLMVIIPGNDQFKPHSLQEFLTTLGRCASWPWIRTDLWWLVNWLPWLLVLVMYLLRKTPDRTWIRFAMALGLWVLMQEVATSYARNTIALHSKYADPMAIGLPVNALALIILYTSLQRGKKMVLLLALCWTLTNGYFLIKLTADDLKMNLPARQHSYRMQIQKTRSYLQSGNIDDLVPREKYEIPHRDPNQYAELLRDPIIHRILPRSINDAAVQSGVPKAYLSRFADTLLAGSLPLFMGGILLMTMISILIAAQHLRKDNQ